jgi:hypothetical protein
VSMLRKSLWWSTSFGPFFSLFLPICMCTGRSIVGNGEHGQERLSGEVLGTVV